MAVLQEDTRSAELVGEGHGLRPENRATTTSGSRRAHDADGAARDGHPEEDDDAAT